jgi:hypothetical protein
VLRARRGVDRRDALLRQPRRPGPHRHRGLNSCRLGSMRHRPPRTRRRRRAPWTRCRRELGFRACDHRPDGTASRVRLPCGIGSAIPAQIDFSPSPGRSTFAFTQTDLDEPKRQTELP